MMTTQQTPNLLAAEREYLLKERATLIDRLTFVEARLGLPSSIVPKQERERVKLEDRLRTTMRDGLRD